MVKESTSLWYFVQTKTSFLLMTLIFIWIINFSLAFGLPLLKTTTITKNPTFSHRSVFPLAMAKHTLSKVSCDVCVVGSANQDVTVYLHSSSENNQKLSKEPYSLKWGETVITTSGSNDGKGCEMACGGKGANQAVAAASFSPTNVHMICRVGKDSFGQALLQNLRDANVSYPHDDLVFSNGSTGMASILVDGNTGDNMIVVVPGANHHLLSENIQIPEKCNVLLTQLEIPMQTAKRACQLAVEEGCLSILNPAPCNGITIPDEMYQNIDILVPNELELKELYHNYATDVSDNEEAMAKSILLAKGIRQAVIVTLGARGAMIVARGDNLTTTTSFIQAPTQLSCNNEPVVDTVGAGDAFCGALAAHLSTLPRGTKIQRQDLIQACTKACGFASMSVRKRGAQTSYPKPNEVPECLRIVSPQKQMESSSTAIDTLSKIPLTFVTGNKNKLKEVEKILNSDHGSFPYKLTNMKLDLPELQGRDTFEIAREKCKWAAKFVNGPVLIEDTSLCFSALNNLPGPYIKWFLDSCGHEGLNKMLVGFDDKTAYAQTLCAVCFDGGTNVHIIEGKTYGKIVKARGENKFGWDPIFEPDEGGGKTYAEMTLEEKNEISHRARALAKLKILLHSMK